MQGPKPREISRATLLASGRGPRGIGVRTTDRVTARYLRDLDARIAEALKNARQLQAEIAAMRPK